MKCSWDFKYVDRLYDFYPEPRCLKESHSDNIAQYMATYERKEASNAHDFIEKLLVIDPAQRLCPQSQQASAMEIWAHPWLLPDVSARKGGDIDFDRRLGFVELFPGYDDRNNHKSDHNNDDSNDLQLTEEQQDLFADF
jgi:hypothetical protein